MNRDSNKSHFVSANGLAISKTTKKCVQFTSIGFTKCRYFAAIFVPVLKIAVTKHITKISKGDIQSNFLFEGMILQIYVTLSKISPITTNLSKKLI